MIDHDEGVRVVVSRLVFEEWMTRMTYPSYVPVLDRLREYAEEGIENTDPEIFAYGAKIGNEGIGLCLARRVAYANEVEVLSLYVAFSYRRCGVASALLTRMQDELRRRGNPLRAAFIVDRHIARILVRVGAKLGWARPRLVGYHARCSIERILESQYFGEQFVERVKGRLRIRPWHDLSRAEVTAMRESNEVKRWITVGLEPWDYAYAKLHPASRVAVDTCGRAVGWILLQRINDNEVRIACAFMHADHSMFGRSLALWKSALLASRDAAFQDCSFVTYSGHGPMVSLLLRRASGLVAITPIRESCCPGSKER